jgi:hypothetical protein
VLLFSATLAAAQCESNYERITLQCADNAECHDFVILDMPIEGFVYKYTTNVLNCCGQLFTDTNMSGSCDADIVQPAIRKQVERLAATSDVLVADCRGHYVPYDSTAKTVQVRQNRARRFDDPLRR